MEKDLRGHFRAMMAIMGAMECSKHFRCASSEFRDWCKAEFDDSCDSLVCLDDKPEACEFATQTETGFLCGCDIRIYASKNLGLQSLLGTPGGHIARGVHEQGGNEWDS